MEAAGVALVTGASRGIGRATALELAARGFEVVAAVRDPDGVGDLVGEASARGGVLRLATLDVTRPERFDMPSDLRVLVNNAGADAAYLPVEHAPLSLWRSLFETNLFGLVAVTAAAIPALRAAGGGVICNVTSCSVLAPMPFFAAYRASKAAVGALGESLRSELAPQGIRVVEVMPGAIETDMLHASERQPEAIVYPAYEAVARRVVSQRAAVSGGTPVEQAADAIADAILDDDPTLRRSCDPMGAGLLATWRSSSDEDLMRSMVEAFTAEPAPDDAD